MSNYPTGAEDDPNAPYNQTENPEKECEVCEGSGNLCRKCDEPMNSDVCKCGSITKYACMDCEGTGFVEMTDDEAYEHEQSILDDIAEAKAERSKEY